MNLKSVKILSLIAIIELFVIFPLWLIYNQGIAKTTPNAANWSAVLLSIFLNFVLLLPIPVFGILNLKNNPIWMLIFLAIIFIEMFLVQSGVFFLLPFYLPWGTEFAIWALMHGDYRAAQLRQIIK